ncbi:MFS transporter [Oceanobacillus zhaokaii]|uniref:MFS transporter n=1 Tax=Oceanobacillus zhaokaii TaxID=2052660 RepID=UPI0013B36AF1|nr:MFS transporter [Oceanobacillus zhaokaii]
MVDPNAIPQKVGELTKENDLWACSRVILKYWILREQGGSAITDKRKEVILVATMLMGTALVPLNATMVAVALTAMANSFDISLASVSWVVTVYLIVMAAVQPIAGKLGDLYGNRFVFMIGLFLMLGASIACVFSFHLIWLIGFRALLAFGGALTAPNANAIIRQTVPPRRLGEIFGILSFGMGLGTAIGPVIGGLVMSIWGWPSIFWVNVPVIVIAIFSTLYLVPKVQKGPSSSLDVSGSLYLAVVFTLANLLVHGQSVWEYIMMGAALLVSLFFFIRRERNAKAPLIDFSLFRNLSFLSANLSILISNFFMYSTILAIPLILEADFALSSEIIGWVVFIFSMTMALCSMLGGYLADRTEKGKLVFCAFLAMVGVSALYIVFFTNHSLAYLIVVLVMAGISRGIGLTSMKVVALEAVRPEMSGIASGIYSTFRYMGSMVASTLVSLLTGSVSLFVVMLFLTFAGVFVSRGIGKTSVSAGPH